MYVYELLLQERISLKSKNSSNHMYYVQSQGRCSDFTPRLPKSLFPANQNKLVKMNY